MSETESIEYWSLEAEELLNFSPFHGVDEMVIVLSGRATLSGRDIVEGCVALVPRDTEATLRARDQTKLVCIRVLPDAVAARLPTRIPELPIDERTI